MPDNIKAFKWVPMNVSFQIFVKPDITEQQVRSFVDTVIHHAQITVMNDIGSYVFHIPTVKKIEVKP